jgi:hypothetical protein
LIVAEDEKTDLRSMSNFGAHFSLTAASTARDWLDGTIGGQKDKLSHDCRKSLESRSK